ncbi:MAG: cytochrome c biogenesis protein ResB, partial [Cyanobacteria bacterium J06648_11]
EANVFRAIAAPDGAWYYAVNASTGFKAGTLPQGEPVALGWADFQIEATEALQHAVLYKEILPASPDDGDAVPALLVEGPRGDRHWMQWGVPESFETDAGTIYAVYRPKSLDLPFSVDLEEFVVDRNEGTDSVAMWTSEIQIAELGTTATAASNRRKVWMNHPTWYRGWKIAQASWNPGDLRQSTLQIKREPAWVTALTWSGSLLVVAGIGVMFYGQEIANRFAVAADKTSNLPSESADIAPEAIA